MGQDNNFSIKGVIYEKPVRVVPNTKNPSEPPYEFRSLVLEIKSSYTTNKGGKEEYHTKTTLPEFQLAKGLNTDNYAIGDFVECRFSVEGKKISPTWHKTELRCSFMKFADLDAGHNTHKGKITVDAMSNPDDLPTPKRETVFVAPDPDGEDFSDLPFIITALIGIGTLMPFMI